MMWQVKGGNISGSGKILISSLPVNRLTPKTNLVELFHDRFLRA